VRVAFVDTSVILTLAFQQSGWQEIAATLESFDSIYACDLLEAEFRSAFRREGLRPEIGFLRELDVIFPTRSLSAEFQRVLDAGSVRGADCFHLAVALSLAPAPSELTFLTLDTRQRQAADALGFRA
jgi:predicted nucleic acid-binding protein